MHRSEFPHKLLLLCCAVLIHGGAFVVLLALPPGPVESVDPADVGAQYAWGENVGWLNAEPQGDGGPGVEVNDTELTGWIWAENAGWISLSCQNTASCGDNDYGVVNNEKGHLSGFAWGENIGWVNFRSSGSDCCVSNGTPGCADSVCEAAICSVDPYCCNNNWDQQCANEASAEAGCSRVAPPRRSACVHGLTGIFSGLAWAENGGWINFGSANPAATQIETDWSCPDPDADGVCSASDNCPTASNPGLGTAVFGQTVRAQDKFDFGWPTEAEFELATGSFGTGASIGTFDVDFYFYGSGTVYTDPFHPPAGFGYWYLFRPNCPFGSYSTGSPSEAPGRDAALIP